MPKVVRSSAGSCDETRADCIDHRQNSPSRRLCQVSVTRLSHQKWRLFRREHVFKIHSRNENVLSWREAWCGLLSCSMTTLISLNLVLLADSREARTSTCSPKASPPSNHILHPSQSTSAAPDERTHQSCAAHCHIALPMQTTALPWSKNQRLLSWTPGSPFNCRRPHIFSRSTIQSKEGALIITNISTLNSSLHTFHPTASPLLPHPSFSISSPTNYSSPCV